MPPRGIGRDRLVVTPQEVAIALGLSLGTVYRHARDHTLPFRKVGRQWLMSLRNFYELVQQEVPDDDEQESGERNA